MTSAVASGDSSVIRGLITSPGVRNRVEDYGRKLRGKPGLSGLHVVPSFIMGMAGHGRFTADFDILGSHKEGRFGSANHVTLRIRGGKATIVSDRPGDWQVVASAGEDGP